MEIRTLTAEQITTVYKRYLTRDFPPTERRSLRNILTLTERDEYSTLGLFEANTLLGYAFFVRHGRDLLIDYFAILDGNRGRGLGSHFLRLIADYGKDAASLIAEIEDPDTAHNEEERTRRLRRKAFYERNGFRDTGARVVTFGVHYRLIETGETTHTADEIRSIYAAHYRSILPAVLFKTQIKF